VVADLLTVEALRVGVVGDLEDPSLLRRACLIRPGFGRIRAAGEEQGTRRQHGEGEAGASLRERRGGGWMRRIGGGQAGAGHECPEVSGWNGWGSSGADAATTGSGA